MKERAEGRRYIKGVKVEKLLPFVDFVSGNNNKK